MVGCMPDVKLLRKGVAGMATFCFSSIQIIKWEDFTSHGYSKCGSDLPFVL